MVKSLHKSKRRMKDATCCQKVQIKNSQKINRLRTTIFEKQLEQHLSLYQIKRDHFIINKLKKYYPEIHLKILEDLEEYCGKSTKRKCRRKEYLDAKADGSNEEHKHIALKLLKKGKTNERSDQYRKKTN